MTIHATDRIMTSDRSPEYAYRAGGGDRWRLTWLPQSLSRAQALAGMRLDELLSDPDVVHDAVTVDRIAEHAATVGIRYEQAVIVLWRRMENRSRRRPRAHDGPDAAEGVAGYGPAPRSLHLLG
ncbi:hypothetical protein [Nocardia sp. BMG111209]|uniref:hypothetical protein n=1 Tax=Nocardia sp. BMG111209 TaxID=1160137 RepID=UPI0003A9F6FE|nr:hypothetical protein [Nocardia sp. BMG111209]